MQHNTISVADAFRQALTEHFKSVSSLRIENGLMSSVTLIFDSARLPYPPSSEQADPDAQSQD